jgi:hypothetical protein
MHNERVNRFATVLIFLCVYFLVASAAFEGFFNKWQFRDDAKHFSIAQMLDGTADRPYVYRQLLPEIAKRVVQVMPGGLRQKIESHLSEQFPEHNPLAKLFPRAKYSSTPAIEIQYYLIYLMAFAALFVSMILLRVVCLELAVGNTAAALAPLVFALLIPMISTEGGYYYDMPEIGFMAAGVLLAKRGRYILLILLSAIATYNKESFLFFAITLFPFLRERYSLRPSAAIVFGMVIAAGLVNFLVKAHFAGNGGGVVEVQFFDNIRALIRPSTYFHFEWTYGVLFPQGLNVITLLLIYFITKSGWSRLSVPSSRHAKLALILNIPLFLAFCRYDELRNFSMLYISLVSLLACGIANYIASAGRDNNLQVSSLRESARHSDLNDTPVYRQSFDTAIDGKANVLVRGK